jgi:hypothetical protein
MKKKIALALCTLGLAGGVAAPAQASSIQQQSTAAYTWATNNCLRYTGCSQLSFNQINDYYGCHSWHYNMHTKYYGWMDGWTPWFC